jgi:hypothetical protein
MTDEEHRRATDAINAERDTERPATGPAAFRDYLRTRPANIVITSTDDHGIQRAVRTGEVVALLKWSGSVIKVYFPGGTILGRLYRSDGGHMGGQITYTYRAWTAGDRLECKPTDTEVARGVSLGDAVAALLQHAADAGRQA